MGAPRGGRGAGVGGDGDGAWEVGEVADVARLALRCANLCRIQISHDNGEKKCQKWQDLLTEKWELHF